MPISINTNFSRLSARALPAAWSETAPVSGFVPPSPAPLPVPPAPALPLPGALSALLRPPVEPPATPALTASAIAGLLPVRPFPTIPPVVLGPILPQAPQTATQLARGALAQLNSVNPSAVTEAINAIRSAGLDGPGIMTQLERKTPVRAVMESLAKDWAETTRNDFADQAFRMAHDHFDAMDSIVSLAILNDRDLEAEIISENTPETSPADLMDNRRVVWQYPPPGTVLQPPYVVLVAVEYRDVATAQDVFRSIVAELGVYQGLKVPNTVIQKLG